MRKFFIALFALFFTLPAFATPAHWTCSNDQTVMYLVVDGSDGKFILFDNKGGFLGSSTFTKQTTDSGNPFFYAEIGTAAIGVTRVSETAMVLAIARGGEVITKMDCQ